jgi:3-oxoacyl-[acyl-carrier protein] reductase
MESVENDEGKVVLVTGGARGIGYAISKVFYSNGYTVVISDLDEDAAKSAILEIDPNKKRTFAIKLDVASSESVDRGIAQIKDKYGKLNVLINNAGNFRQAPSATYSDEDWEFVTGVHLDGTFRCVRAAYPLHKTEHELVNRFDFFNNSTDRIAKKIVLCSFKSRHRSLDPCIGC